MSLGVVDLKDLEVKEDPESLNTPKEVDPQDEVWTDLVRTLDRLERGIEGDMSLLGRSVRSLNRFRMRMSDYTWLRVIYSLIPQSYRKEFLDSMILFVPNLSSSELTLISKLGGVSIDEAGEKLKSCNNDVYGTILKIVSEKEELAKEEIKKKQNELKQEREEREAKKLEKEKQKGKNNAKSNIKKKDDKSKKDDSKSKSKDEEGEKEIDISLLPLKDRKKKRQFYPETYVFLQLLLGLELFDKKNYGPSIEILSKLINFTKTQNRRTCDLLTARVYQFYSLNYQRIGNLPKIRKELYELYQTCCLQQNEAGQGVLINLILQNYISDNLYSLAHKFAEKCVFPESCDSQQWARYRYYCGRIDTVQLDYSNALFNTQQAIRRAPQTGAITFKLTSTKWLIVIHLLMGDVPDRNVFRSFKLKANREKLLPYLDITNAVREGKIDQFNQCLLKHDSIFKSDGLDKILLRLRHNVIKTGLRAINKAYSRVSLQDICNKLGLPSSKDAYFIVAKAIRDGVIEATIDYDKQYVETKELPNIYNTSEPYEQYSNRIKFCLDIYNTGVKSLRYPQDKQEKKEDDKDKLTPEEIAEIIEKELQEENED